jgi:hypothetical protein
VWPRVLQGCEQRHQLGLVVADGATGRNSASEGRSHAIQYAIEMLNVPNRIVDSCGCDRDVGGVAHVRAQQHSHRRVGHVRVQ